MRIELLPISEQVMVITGASSGIGLVTAKQAAQRGACVVLSARNGEDLARAVEEIRQGRSTLDFVGDRTRRIVVILDVGALVRSEHSMINVAIIGGW